MPLDGKLLAQAREHLAAIKQHNEETLEARRREVYARVPETAQCERALRAVMVRLLSAALRPGAEQASPAVPCAEQNLAPEAQIHHPVQHGGNAGLQPRPILPRHAVVEHDDELIHHHAQQERGGAVPLTRCCAVCAKQRAFLRPPRGGGEPAPQHRYKIKAGSRQQKQQQRIRKTKQKGHPSYNVITSDCQY